MTATFASKYLMTRGNTFFKWVIILSWKYLKKKTGTISTSEKEPAVVFKKPLKTIFVKLLIKWETLLVKCVYSMIPFHKQQTSFICNGKEWGVSKSEGERERKIVRGGVWVERVTAWVINLTIGGVFVRA
jgi:hypothetical protein